MKKKIKVIFLLLIFLFFFQATLAAQHSFWDPDVLAQKVRRFLEKAIEVGVIIAFFSLVLAGFQYLTSAGKVEQMEKAKKRIFGAFLGLILLLGGWLFLGVFRPEFSGISLVSPSPIPTSSLPSLELPESAYVAFAEIPIETFLKGKENGKVGENSQYFNLEELKEVKEYLENDYLPFIKEIENKFDELKKIVEEGCACFLKTQAEGGSRICTLTKTVPPACPLFQSTCRAEKCSGDPCKGAREKMGEKMAEITSLAPQLNEKNNELRKKILPIKERMAKLSLALKMIKDCPFDSVFTRDVFNSMLDYLRKEAPNVNWQVSRIPFFEEIERPRSNSFVDFYCPKTGFVYYSPSLEEINQTALEYVGSNPTEVLQSWEEIIRQTKEATTVSPEYELDISCPFSAPFGEMMEKFLAALGEIIKRFDNILESSPKIHPQINDYYQLTFECKPENCNLHCYCSFTFTSLCSCLCFCTGNPCPPALFFKEGEVRSNFHEIEKNIKELNYSDIEKWLANWEKIEKEVRKRETPLTPQEIRNLYSTKFSDAKEIVAFEIMASRMHYCLAQFSEVEAGWMLSSCDEYKGGSLTPEGKRTKGEEDCKCENLQECQNSYPVLSSYKCDYLAPANWLAQFLGLDSPKCHLFNYFCCRPFEKK